MTTALVIRHFPDRKKPCLVLEQGNECIVIGTLRNGYCESLLREYFNDSCGIYGDMRYLFDMIQDREEKVIE
jgi:hypothetical protein